MSIYIVHFVKK